MTQGFFVKKPLLEARAKAAQQTLMLARLKLIRHNQYPPSPELDKRLGEFATGLDQEDKEMVLGQFQRFIETLEKCLKAPEKVDSYIQDYLNGFYYPVGIMDKMEPDLANKRRIRKLLYVSLVLGISSIPLFADNHPLVGALLLIGAIIFALPQIFDWCFSEPLNQDLMKSFERLLFTEVSDIMSREKLISENKVEEESPTP